MDKLKFDTVIIGVTNKLTEHGYHVHTDPAPHSVEVVKTLLEDVVCVIRFQLIHVPYINKFQVILIRRTSRPFASEGTLYQPLFIDLHNLMFGLYKQDVISTSLYALEFEDEASLLTQAAYAENLILKYGIKWLEDPLSNMDWVKEHRS